MLYCDRLRAPHSNSLCNHPPKLGNPGEGEREGRLHTSRERAGRSEQRAGVSLNEGQF